VGRPGIPRGRAARMDVPEHRLRTLLVPPAFAEGQRLPVASCRRSPRMGGRCRGPVAFSPGRVVVGRRALPRCSPSALRASGVVSPSVAVPPPPGI
jgi:hypothetical protein